MVVGLDIGELLEMLLDRLPLLVGVNSRSLLRSLRCARCAKGQAIFLGLLAGYLRHSPAVLPLLRPSWVCNVWWIGGWTVPSLSSFEKQARGHLILMISHSRSA